MPYDPAVHRQYHREYGRRRRAAGKCACGQAAVPGKDRCAACAAKLAATVRAKRHARLAAGLCPLCPVAEVRPLAEGKSLCQFHLDRRSAADARHYAKKTGAPPP